MSLLTNYSLNINLKIFINISTNSGKRLSPSRNLAYQTNTKSTDSLRFSNGLHARNGGNNINLIKK